MLGSYLDTMSDPPSWTSMTGSGKGTGPLRIHRRLSGRRSVSSGHHKRAPPRDGSTAVHSPSGERRASASGLVGGAATHQQQRRVVRPDLGLGHCCEPARRRRAHLRVNVGHRAHVVARSGEETRGETENDLGFLAFRPVRHSFVLARVALSR
jgi:hypothetical protein